MLQKLRDAMTSVGFVAQNSSDWMSYRKRCIYCGGTDSSVQDHMHVLVSETGPILVKCFRPMCPKNKGGILTEEDMVKLGIVDSELIEYVTDRNGEVVTHKRVNGVRVYSYPPLSKRSKEYIKKRTGIDINENNIEKYKLVDNMKAFCRENRLTEPKEKFNGYVGFVSTDGSMIRFRNILNDGRRFKSYRLFPDGDSSYTIGTLDVYGGPQRVNIVEGMFDAMNIDNMDGEENSVTISTNSFTSYDKYINNTLNMKRNIALHIYLDKDISENLVDNILERILYKLTSPVLYIRNKHAKDFGDIREKQKEIIVKIFGGN